MSRVNQAILHGRCFGLSQEIECLSSGPPRWRDEMTICPVAIAVGCRRCPIFKVCPAKGVIGDYRKGEADKEEQPKQSK